jgi:hypothetical protein
MGFGFLSSKRMVRPDRAVPWMLWAASKKDSVDVVIARLSASGPGGHADRNAPSQPPYDLASDQ